MSGNIIRCLSDNNPLRNSR